MLGANGRTPSDFKTDKVDAASAVIVASGLLISDPTKSTDVKAFLFSGHVPETSNALLAAPMDAHLSYATFKSSATR